MQREIHTFFDRVNNCNDATILLKHIAKMLAMKNQEYTDAYAADDLRYAIAEEMLAFAHKTKGQNFEVVCTYQGVTESSTFRAMELFCITELVHDIMDIEEYMDKVINPIAKELAARIIAQIDGPLSATSCDIVVRLA